MTLSSSDRSMTHTPMRYRRRSYPLQGEASWVTHWALLLAVPVLLAILPIDQRLEGAETVDYVRQVKPIFKQRCYACHGALKQKARLRLDTAQFVRRGGDGGPAIEAGQAGESLLIDR